MSTPEKEKEKGVCPCPRGKEKRGGNTRGWRSHHREGRESCFFLYSYYPYMIYIIVNGIIDLNFKFFKINKLLYVLQLAHSVHLGTREANFIVEDDVQRECGSDSSVSTLLMEERLE